MKRSLGTVSNSPIVRKYHDKLQAMIDSGEVRRDGALENFWEALNAELVAAGLLTEDEADRDGDGDLCLGFHGENHSELFIADWEAEAELEEQDFDTAVGQ